MIRPFTALCLGTLALTSHPAHALSLFWPTPAWWQWSPPPPAPREPGPLVVIDTDGKTLGRLNDRSAYANLDDRLVRIALDIAVDETGAYSSYLTFAQHPISFSTTDCTGVPYLPASNGLGALATAAVKTGDSWQLYVADAMQSQAQRVEIKSAQQAGVCRSTGDPYHPTPPAAVVPASGPHLLDFRPPLSVR